MSEHPETWVVDDPLSAWAGETVVGLSDYLKVEAQADALRAERDRLVAALTEARAVICAEWCSGKYHAEPCLAAAAALCNSRPVRTKA